MRAVLYVHGMGGTADEARQYEDLFNAPVFGLAYTDASPWAARESIRKAYEELAETYDEIDVIAVSIGVYFTMLGLYDKPVSGACFISPIVDMEQLVLSWMAAQNVTEAELAQRGVIPNRYGEPFSWKYLSFVRENPVRWSAPTEILYGTKDNLMSAGTVRAFALEHHAALTVIEAEHYIRPTQVRPFLKGAFKKRSTTERRKLMKLKKSQGFYLVSTILYAFAVYLIVENNFWLGITEFAAATCFFALAGQAKNRENQENDKGEEVKPDDGERP